MKVGIYYIWRPKKTIVKFFSKLTSNSSVFMQSLNKKIKMTTEHRRGYRRTGYLGYSKRSVRTFSHILNNSFVPFMESYGRLTISGNEFTS